MNIDKIFKAEYDGKLDKFLSKLSEKQIKLLIQQFKDYLKNYERVTANYTPEKMKKFGQPHKDRYLRFLNILYKEYTKRIEE